MQLPALEDIAAHTGSAQPIEGVTRIETSPREKATPIIMEMIHSVYPHDEVFGQYSPSTITLTARPTNCSPTWPIPAV